MLGIKVNIIEVIEETLRTETGLMSEAEAGSEIIQKDSVGIEEKADIGIEVDHCLRIKVRKEDVITVETQTITINDLFDIAS